MEINSQEMLEELQEILGQKEMTITIQALKIRKLETMIKENVNE